MFCGGGGGGGAHPLHPPPSPPLHPNSKVNSSNKTVSLMMKSIDHLFNSYQLIHHNKIDGLRAFMTALLPSPHKEDFEIPSHKC